MHMVMSMKGGGMNGRHSIEEARRNLPRLIREAERGRTVRLARRGEPVAVLVGYRTFERIATGRRSFVEAMDRGFARIDAGFAKQAARMEIGFARIDAGFAKQAARMEIGFARIDAGFAKQAARMEIGFAEQAARMDRGFANINARFDQLETRIERRITQQTWIILGAMIAVRFFMEFLGFAA